MSRLLAETIAENGPIPVERFMALALGHPVHGYYRVRDPLGRAGDFTTAPEISQMFGELLGVWAAEVWHAMGRPAVLHLVELGPGRGTLMADALRAARVLPAFRDALRVHLVETSPVLRERQRAALASDGVPTAWHEILDTVPPGPMIVLANEFLDALPVRQYVRGPAGWHERVVGIGADGALAFGLAAAPEPRLTAPAPGGTLVEIGDAAATVAAALGARLARDGGAALLVDYGHVRTAPGETLQAVHRHGYAGVLDRPGEHDLTAHVDFEAIGRAARAAGARCHGPVGQGAFLHALGIAGRAERLSRDADPARRETVRAALHRLTGPGPAGMGDLFKVLGLSGQDLPALPGLPTLPHPERPERDGMAPDSSQPHSEDPPC